MSGLGSWGQALRSKTDPNSPLGRVKAQRGTNLCPFERGDQSQSGLPNPICRELCQSKKENSLEWINLKGFGSVVESDQNTQIHINARRTLIT